jgi:hypothetical protein
LAEAITLLAHTLRQNNTRQILDRIDRLERKLMASNAELTADLKLVLAQQVKTAGEIATVQASVDTLNAKIVELEAIIAAGVTPSQELIDAVAAVKAQAQIIDDQIPDVVVPPVQ